jgi:hypothetical protein
MLGDDKQQAEMFSYVTMEQIDYNLLYRWFVGLGIDEAVWDDTVLSKNRERLIAGQSAVVAGRGGAGACASVAERGALHGRWNAFTGLLPHGQVFVRRVGGLS